LRVAVLGGDLRSGEHIRYVIATLIVIVKEVVHSLFKVIVGFI
jgi:hypothetical protein